MEGFRIVFTCCNVKQTLKRCLVTFTTLARILWVVEDDDDDGGDDCDENAW